MKNPDNRTAIRILYLTKIFGSILPCSYQYVCWKLFRRNLLLFLFTSLLICACQSGKQQNKFQSLNTAPVSPEETYGQLFVDIQTNENIFPDSKTFVDCIPLYEADTILKHYQSLRENRDALLMRNFIEDHFIIPGNERHYVSDSSSINEHISQLWDILKRPADSMSCGTLIPLPYPYIVPGGRFREVYYWDSYFTMLGLKADGRKELIRDIVANFSWLIDIAGHIPNGNRSYYISRSQPPFYSLMVELLAEIDGDTVCMHYLPQLEKEYSFWMDGGGQLDEDNPALRRLVRLPDGAMLNRYWDDKNTPRPESYREDIATARKAIAGNPALKKEDLYRNLRAAAESGWDFSSRWLAQEEDGSFNLSTIHTTDIIPIDLNSLLYKLENCLARAYHLKNDSIQSMAFLKKAELRKQALMKYCWNSESGFFEDYNFKTQKSTKVHSLAAMYPLFFNMITKEQAERVSSHIRNSFLKPGGVVTSLNRTGEQWDAPNGWAPLQWIAIQGLRNYNHTELANEIKARWLTLNEQVYYDSFKMLEKYNVEDQDLEGGGGEYPNQDGFGWTNGVYQQLDLE